MSCLAFLKSTLPSVLSFVFVPPPAFFQSARSKSSCSSAAFPYDARLAAINGFTRVYLRKFENSFGGEKMYLLFEIKQPIEPPEVFAVFFPFILALIYFLCLFTPPCFSDKRCQLKFCSFTIFITLAILHLRKTRKKPSPLMLLGAPRVPLLRQ